MSNKRQQTMAKMTRERTVREKRAKKLEKKQAARAEKKARAAGEWPIEETGLDTEDAESSATVLDAPVEVSAEPPAERVEP